MADNNIIISGSEGVSAEPGILNSNNVSGMAVVPGANMVSLPLTNTWASIETQDVAGFVGYPGLPGVQLSLGATEAADTMALVGNVASVGTWVSTDPIDTMSAYGTLPVTGTWHSTEAQDVLAALGFGRGADGTFVVTEAQDRASITVAVPPNGTLAAVETPDKMVINGAGVSRVRPRRVLLVT